jgi:hypothetical protein
MKTIATTSKRHVWLFDPLIKAFSLFTMGDRPAALQPDVQKVAILNALPVVRDSGFQVFWKNSIAGIFNARAEELIIYFCVSRSASRARKTQQQIQAEGGSAEVLRLVGWDLENPAVAVEVSVTGPAMWECRQLRMEGVREPFGYVVLSSSYSTGVVNSFSVRHEDLYRNPVRFLLDENSSCVRLTKFIESPLEAHIEKHMGVRVEGG